jgi:hypothetical protein
MSLASRWTWMRIRTATQTSIWLPPSDRRVWSISIPTPMQPQTLSLNHHHRWHSDGDFPAGLTCAVPRCSPIVVIGSSRVIDLQFDLDLDWPIHTETSTPVAHALSCPLHSGDYNSDVSNDYSNSYNKISRFAPHPDLRRGQPPQRVPQA